MTIEEIVAQYKTMLLAIARRWTGDQDEADDIVQRVFIKLSRHVGTLDNPRTYIFASFYNALSDARRLRKSTVQYDHAGLASPDSRDARDELLDVVPTIAEMPAQFRVAFLLWAQGWNGREIGLQLGLTEGAAKMHASRGLQWLRKRHGWAGEGGRKVRRRT